MGPWTQQAGTLTDREDLAYIREQYGTLYEVTKCPVSGFSTWEAAAKHGGDKLTGETADALLWAIRRHYWARRYCK